MRQKKNLIHMLKSFNLYTAFRFYMMRGALRRKPYDPYAANFYSPNQQVNDRIKKVVTKQDIENVINDFIKGIEITHSTSKDIRHTLTTIKFNLMKSHIFYDAII